MSTYLDKFPQGQVLGDLIAEMGFEPHGLAKFSAENLASCHQKVAFGNFTGLTVPRTVIQDPRAARDARYLRVIRLSDS